jgi:hypothetical protein
MDQSETDGKKRTRIPKLRFRQAVNKVKIQREEQIAQERQVQN